MGMFDEIKCDYPLPDKEVQEETFQTKDFECRLEQYTITKDGEIIHHTVRRELVPEEEREYYGKPEWDAIPFARMFGMIRSIPTGDVKLPYHGDLLFYTYLGDPNNDDCKWYEYEARFTEGKITSLNRAIRRGNVNR